jgi:AAA ATPase-like protein
MDASPTAVGAGWPIVGRDEELSVLRRATDAARGRIGGLVIVEGPPGSGRTRLVGEAASMARESDFRVVWLPDHADAASSVAAAAVDDAARGHRVVIVHDQEGSPPFPSDRFDLSRLPALVLATRTVGAADEPRANGSYEATVTRLGLEPLGAGAVSILARHIGTGLSLSALERLRAATGGNALLVVETLAALQGRDEVFGEAEPLPISQHSLAWMRSHLFLMSHEARIALEAASIFGVQSDPTLVARVLGEPSVPSEVRSVLATSPFTMLWNGVEPCRFTPPLARELIYASLSPERRAMLHARAATALAGHGPATFAHRSLAAAAAGDARRCEHWVRRLLDAQATAGASVTPSRWPYFVREGEHWAIGFGERAIRLNDRAGLLYLARLLSRPGIELPATALGDRRRAKNAPNEASGEPTVAAERARVRVTRRIRDGIERIARIHPELGAHLEQTIRTGARCVYVIDPVHAPRWEIRLSL